MLASLKCYIFINICLVFVKCLIPSLTVQKIDRNVIQKKRQDTLEMCRLFNEGHSQLQQQMQSYQPFNKEPYAKHTRSKRQASEMKLGNPVLDEESIKRVESIVDKLYEDLNEKVTYRQRKLESTTAPTTVELNKTMRRFNFAPELIRLETSTTIHPSAINNDLETPPVLWHKKWKHGVIPFFIDPKTYDAHLADVIMKAFDYFEKATCIRLQKLREKPTDQESMQNVEWLYISNPSGIRQCVHSNEKKPNTGVQAIVFGYDCLSLGQIVHEIMHVLGFSHEHTRPDRDQYISILWNNIKPGYKKYFEKRTSDRLLNIPYDYSSVLHYPARAFSKNGQVTIMGQVGLDVRLGQREGLSEADVEKVTYIFGHECMDRNKQYLLKTCPSAVRANVPRTNVSREDITNYFRDRIWPYGVVNYKIKDKMEFSTEERENIKAVITHIESETCIRFKEIPDDKSKTDDETSPAESNGFGDSDGGDQPDQNDDIDNGDEGNNNGGNDGDNGDGDNVTVPYTEEGEGNATENSGRDVEQGENEILSENDPVKNETTVADALRKGKVIGKNKKKPKKKINVSKIIKPSRFRKRNTVKASRRHAAHILVIERSAEPGCQCPPPGKPAGMALLKINADCFNSVNDLLHLFVHLLGLDHQHNMHDRDQYLHILWENHTPEIKQELQQKLPPAASVGYGYDYQSVMHYPWLQIKNGLTSVMYPIWNDGWVMGHWQGLSTIDVQKLNNLYFEQCVERKKQEEEAHQERF